MPTLYFFHKGLFFPKEHVRTVHIAPNGKATTCTVAWFCFAGYLQCAEGDPDRCFGVIRSALGKAEIRQCELADDRLFFCMRYIDAEGGKIVEYRCLRSGPDQSWIGRCRVGRRDVGTCRFKLTEADAEYLEPPPAEAIPWP